MKNEEIVKLSVKSLYRILLKNFQYYPSKNKFNIYLAMKDEFRENKDITNEKKIY